MFTIYVAAEVSRKRAELADKAQQIRGLSFAEST